MDDEEQKDNSSGQGLNQDLNDPNLDEELVDGIFGPDDTLKTAVG